MILGYLILAHLLGDFVLQPNKLVLWKIKSKMGILVHALVHFCINILVLLPFIIKGAFWLIPCALFIAVIHFCIDQTKINYDLKHDKKVLPFLTDQLLHLLTILIAYFFLGKIELSIPKTQFYEIYTNIRIVIFFSLVILATSVVEIYRFQKLREKNRNATLKLNSDKMLNRLIVLTLVYILFMGLSFYARFQNVF